jgi:hypothetical protein
VAKGLFTTRLPRQWPAYVASAGAASLLFFYGTSIPLDYRVRGDAAQYLSAARSFGSLGSALFHVGERANGLPFFEYVLRQNDLRLWTNVVCVALFLLHALACAALTRTLVLKRWIEPRPFWTWLVFSMLVAYPPMVLHTSLPVTDAFGSSVLVLAFCALARPRGLFRAAFAGAALAYAITIRPAYGAGVLAFLVGYATLSRRTRKPATIALAAALLFLLPVGVESFSRYHEFAVQDPATFDPVFHAQMGLKGARLLWFRPDLAEGSEYPILPDAFMRSNFYNRCNLSSIMGIDSSSLTGCLLTRPIDSLLFLAKKWIGLFDPFRLQPYSEQLTPAWYGWLARAFSGIALWGQFLLLGTAALALWRRLRDRSATIDPWSGAVVLFVLVVTALHLALHVEERFSLAWAPYAIAAWVGFASRFRRFTPQRRWLLSGAGLFILVSYWLQILAWDSMMR